MITRVGLFGLLVVMLALASTGSAAAAKIVVTTTTDEYGAGARCSLREAITATNSDAAYGGCRAGSGVDDVRLQRGSVYRRSIEGDDEDGNAAGDLDVASAMTIGPKKGRAAIDAMSRDRVIDVQRGARLDLSRVIVTGAYESVDPNAVDGTGIRTQGKLTASRVRVTGNRTLGITGNGGGLLVSGAGSAKLIDSQVVDNQSGGAGGGISLFAGNLKLRRSTVAGNESGYLGGGLYLTNTPGRPDEIDIEDSTISDNLSGAGGGGIHLELFEQEVGETALFRNVTVSGNSTTGSGGGANISSGAATFESSTVTGNTANSDADATYEAGGGLAGARGRMTFRNSIIAGNFDPGLNTPRPDCFVATSLGHNVVGEDTGCMPQNSDTTGDPKLKPLANNGGPTQTQALKRGSAAIGLADGSTSPSRDQRGIRRDRHPDSGAYERR